MSTASVRSEPAGVVSRRFQIRGVVQGVGFRPFIWRLAQTYGVTGWVRNDGGVVTIRAEGDRDALGAFATAIRTQSPPLARIDDVVWETDEVDGFSEFRVDVSADGAGGGRLIPPDAATCAACLRELFDAQDRRYRYPFINCTDCGPRFTIIDALPYDRDRTSMRAFPMCDACRHEYEDPGDRRFHAEPVACPACGPRLRAVGFEADDVIEGAAALLRGGAIVALKGLGGFHLACDATDPEAVARLRERKRRPDKPFAVMVPSVEDARGWFDPTRAEEAALTSWRAPIVLVRDRGLLAQGVAPGHYRHGAMLPATPLHHLLLRAVDRPLVMTSGNASDEPICIDDGEAFERLGRIADAFVVHDRAIVARYDDTVVVVRSGADAPSVHRRARSFAPEPIELVQPVSRPMLGVGALLHGAFCLATGRTAFLSQHVGDLDTEDAAIAYRDAYDRAQMIFRVQPELVAHDLHPDFMTTRFARSLGVPAVAVQHHHAHVAATMAEHGLEGTVLGLAFDGLGLGGDGTIWGGELFVCDAGHYRRVGHLRAVRQPGGDAATRSPWRMALAHAADAGVPSEAEALLHAPEDEAEIVRGQLASGLSAPWTTSMGRLFDAVAALTGVCRRATYEGQPAMLLEQAAGPPDGSTYPFPVDEDRVIDTRPAIRAIVRDLTGGEPASNVAARFHDGLAAGVADASTRLTGAYGLRSVVLGGGVFQNDLFTTLLIERLERMDLHVFLPRDVPVGDGGIALGQVWVATHREVS